MVVTQHGMWELYKPPALPEGAPPNTLFARRQSDRIDWYDFLKLNRLRPNTVKMTVGSTNQVDKTLLIQAVSRDATTLFPPGQLVIEIDDHGTQEEALWETYSQREFDPVANVIKERKEPVPEIISDRQFYQALALREVITKEEALAAVRVGEIPPELQQLIEHMDQEHKFEAEMLISGATQFERHHPLLNHLAEDFGWSQEQFDDLWRFAATL